jgi:hypothetical protein
VVGVVRVDHALVVRPRPHRIALVLEHEPEADLRHRRVLGVAGVDRAMVGRPRPRRIALLREQDAEIKRGRRRDSRVCGADRGRQRSGGSLGAVPDICDKAKAECRIGVGHLEDPVPRVGVDIAAALLVGVRDDVVVRPVAAVGAFEQRNRAVERLQRPLQSDGKALCSSRKG